VIASSNNMFLGIAIAHFDFANNMI
jgi:hypothetical protein